MPEKSNVSNLSIRREQIDNIHKCLTHEKRREAVRLIGEDGNQTALLLYSVRNAITSKSIMKTM